MDKQIDIICNYFRTQPVKKAYLFGSYARGDADYKSDIDLMADLDEQVGLFKFISMQIRLEELLKRKVDLISSRGISKHILPFIEKDKKLIYER
ncbi:MAG TPA: nucleotidyltransferase domain-containing protein [Cyclobacteriaceae bacterium]|nr:nucleotidyltransferase domain-containing protein [Cyclobacteriaceae bacterium]